MMNDEFLEIIEQRQFAGSGGRAVCRSRGCRIRCARARCVKIRHGQATGVVLMSQLDEHARRALEPRRR